MREYATLPKPRPPCSSGTINPNMPNSRSSSMNSGGSSAAASQARRSSSRPSMRSSTASTTLFTSSRSSSVGSGKGKSTSSRISPAHSERMKLAVGSIDGLASWLMVRA